MKQNFYHVKVFTTLLFATLISIHTILAQGFSPSTKAKLQAVLEQFQAQYGVGGMAAAINVDGLAVWEGATGYASQDIDFTSPIYALKPSGIPFTTNTLSRIYSVTKTFTAALTLELVNEGVLSLNEPISKYFPIESYNPLLDGDVTIHQLLSHTSGFSDFLTNPALLGAVSQNPTKIWAPTEVLSFATKENEPGAISKYSNTNYIILGIIIERITGKEIEDHFRERFFDPLSLETAYMAGHEPSPTGGFLAWPHENLQLLGFPVNSYTNFGYLFPFDGIESIAFTSGGIVSDVGDLAEWGNALYGGRATSKATLDLMLNSMASTPDEDGDYLGYGIFRNNKISETDVFYGHNGAAPGYRSVMFYQPDREMTIAIVSNFSGAQLYEVAKALYAVLPNFIGGNDNRKEAKIVMCWNGKTHTVARSAARNFMQKGAYLGSCEVAIASNKGKNKSVAMLQESMEAIGTSELLAYPNPSRNHFNFRIQATESGNANLSIYDLSGRLVRVVYNGYMQKGEQRTVSFNGSQLSAGHYFGRLQTAAGLRQQKLVVER